MEFSKNSIDKFLRILYNLIIKEKENINGKYFIGNFRYLKKVGGKSG